MSEITNLEVAAVFKAYKAAMRSIGRSVKLQQSTDITKTYAYRSISKFIHNMKNIGLSQDVYLKMIKPMVEYAKMKGLLGRGITVLILKQTLQICYDYLKTQVLKGDLLINDIDKSSSFLKQNINNLEEVLLKKQNRNSYANIVKWLKSGDLSINYVSLSKSCRKAINKLDKIDREMLPDDFKLLKMRINILSDKELRNEVIDIMGSDIWLSGDSLFEKK
jgi:hypothetical protein